jgi:D-sedoheptulose 7-phosphate isomerase
MISPHLDSLAGRTPALVHLREDIAAGYTMMRDSIAAGGKLLLCGNGGSAADADHWSGELLKGFRRLRPLDAMQKAGLPPSIADSLQGAIPAIPLTGFSALATAFANDVDGDLTFAQLTHALGKKGDVWIGLSTSGDARNVCAAAQVARARGLATIAFTGESGGALAPLCDLSIKVPTSETYRTQEYHLPIYHCLCLMLEDHFFAV